MKQELWIARSTKGYLTLIAGDKPHIETIPRSDEKYWSNGGCDYIHLKGDIFPNVTFETSPQRIKLTLVKDL